MSRRGLRKTNLILALFLLAQVIALGIPSKHTKSKIQSTVAIVTKLADATTKRVGKTKTTQQKITAAREDNGKTIIVDICISGCKKEDQTQVKVSDITSGARIKIDGSFISKNRIAARNIESLESITKDGKVDAVMSEERTAQGAELQHIKIRELLTGNTTRTVPVALCISGCPVGITQITRKEPGDSITVKGKYHESGEFIAEREGEISALPHFENDASTSEEKIAHTLPASPTTTLKSVHLSSTQENARVGSPTTHQSQPLRFEKGKPLSRDTIEKIVAEHNAEQAKELKERYGISGKGKGISYSGNRIIVKFNESLDASASSIVRHKKSFKEFITKKDGSGEKLDRINAKFKLKSAQPIFRAEKEEIALEGLSNEKVLRTSFLKTEWTKKIKKLRGTKAVPAGAGAVKSEPKDLSQVYTFDFDSGTNINEVLREYGNNPAVEYVQPALPVLPLEVPNDPLYSSSGRLIPTSLADQWGLKSIKAEAAWDTTKGQTIKVAVIDTGVDAQHPDLIGQVDVARGYNALTDQIGGDTNDSVGHGTMVAGIIAARDNNTYGMVGVAPRATIIPIKVFGTGATDWSTISRAIHYAVDIGAKVINLSLGDSGTTRNNIAEDALAYAYDNNVVVVQAAGNASNDIRDSSPLNMVEKRPIVVAGSGPTYFPWAWSNMGPTVDVSAPAGGYISADWTTFTISYMGLQNVLSLKSRVTEPVYLECEGPNFTTIPCDSYDGPPPADPMGTYGYIRAHGTSFAAPYVSGVVALIRHVREDLTVEQIRQILRSSARDVTEADESEGFKIIWGTLVTGYDIFSGAGVVDATKAVQLAQQATTFPTVRINSPTINNSLVTSQPVQVNATISGDDIAAYRLLLFTGAGEPTTLATGSGPVTNAVIATIPPPFGDGTRHTLMLEAADSSGKTFTAYQAFVTENPSDPVDASQPVGFRQTTPSTNGRDVVWVQARTTTSNLNDVFLRDMATEQTVQISSVQNSTGNIGQPVVNENWIIWPEKNTDGSSKIQYYNRSTATLAFFDTHLTSVSELALYGNTVVWEEATDTSSVVKYKDISLNQPIARVSTSSDNQRSPSIFEQKIVWEDRSGASPRIFFKDLQAGSPERELQVPTISNPEEKGGVLYNRVLVRQNPVIEGRLVTYECILNDSGDTDICTYDWNSNIERTLVTDASNQLQPTISGQSVLWFQEVGGNGNVMAQNLTDGVTKFLFSNVRRLPHFYSRGRLVFERNGRINTALFGAAPLTMSAIQGVTVQEGSAIQFNVGVTAPQGVPLLFRNTLPPGAAFNQSTSQFTWTPPYGFVPTDQSSQAVHAVFAVSDGISKASQTAAITVQADRTVPSVPQDLTVTAASGSTASLSWRAATDNSGSVTYHIFRNAVDIGRTQNLTFGDSGLTAGSTYSYVVAAYDPTGNKSAFSNSVVVTPPAPCTDSDGGQNVTVAGLTDGRVNGSGSYFRDVCVTAQGGACTDLYCAAVAEGYCTPAGVTNTLMLCPGATRCQAGRCTVVSTPSPTPTPTRSPTPTITRTPTSTPTAPPPSSCRDSDNGKEIYVTGLADGRVNGVGTYFNDVCVASNGGQCSGANCTGVAEGFCGPNGVSNIVMQCPVTHLCQTGRCVLKVTPPGPSESVNPAPSPVACRDSDGGKNIYVAGLTDGRINGNGSYFNDVCVTSQGSACSGATCTAVSEGFCGASGVTNTLIQCPITHVCHAGRCVSKVLPIGVSG